MLALLTADKHNSRDSNEILLSDKDQQQFIVSSPPGWSLLSTIALHPLAMATKMILGFYIWPKWYVGTGVEEQRLVQIKSSVVD